MKAEFKKMCSEYLGRTATDTCGGEANALNEDHCPPSKQQKSGPQDCVTEGNVLNSVHGSPKQQGECDKAEASPSPQKECDQSRIDMGKLYKDVTATVSCRYGIQLLYTNIVKLNRIYFDLFKFTC